MSSCYIVFVWVDGSGCQVWEFLPSQLISLLFKNRIKAADKFLRNTFSSEVFWSASRNRALTVLELRFLKVLGSVRLSLGLCKILVQFVTTSFDLFPVTLNLFYITHSSSICFPALFKLTKPHTLECRALRRSWMEYGIIMMGCGRGIPEGRDWKNAQGSRPLQVASSSLTVCTFSRRFCIKKWPISFDLLWV